MNSACGRGFGNLPKLCIPFTVYKELFFSEQSAVITDVKTQL